MRLPVNRRAAVGEEGTAVVGAGTMIDTLLE